MTIRESTIPEEARHPHERPALSSPPSPIDAYLQRVRQFSAALFVISALLVALLANFVERSPHLTEINGIVAIALLAGPFIWLFPWSRYHRDLFLGIGLTAVILLSALIYWTGGASSPYFPMYAFIIAMSGAYYEPLALFVITLTTCAGAASYLLYSGPLTGALVLPLLIWIPVLAITAFLCNLLYRGLTRNMIDAERRARLIAALHDIDQAILTMPDEGEILRIATSRLKDLLAVTRVGITVDAAATSSTEACHPDRHGPGVHHALGGDGNLELPLIARGEHLGALHLDCRAIDRSERAELAAIGQKFAAQIAIVLHSARLRRQAEEARALSHANRLKDEFISLLSHELRTPLTAVVGFCELIVAGHIPPAEVPEIIEHVYHAALHLARLVDDLLDISRLDTGRLRLAIQRDDLGMLVRQVAHEAAGISRAHHLCVEVPDDPIWVEIDAKRIQQVLLNLINNAIRYSPGGGTVTIRAEPAGSAILVTVEDQGIGMRPEVLERVFDRFYRAPGAPPDAAATGLGLALCRGLVEAHGGRIWAESEGEGKGSRLRFTIPWASAPTVNAS
ncbi:MAG: hypothetical protein IRY83_13880 [Chloroflexi bacterium]|nr:hypothetical protein [Chloroflexota bacterium]